MRFFSCDRCGRGFAVQKPLDPPPSPKSMSLDNGLVQKLPHIEFSKADNTPTGFSLVEFDLCKECVINLHEWRVSGKRKIPPGGDVIVPVNS